MRRDTPVFRVTSVACPKKEHSRQCNPAAHGVNHDRAGKIVEFFAVGGLEPGLNAEGLIPGNTFKEGVYKANQQESRSQLRVKFGTFGNAARNNGGNSGREGQQEEKLCQFKTIFRHQRFDATEEVDTIGNPIADKEIRYGRHGKISQNFNQCVYLVFLAYRPEFEKGKTCMHRQHHDGAKQDKQHIATGLICFHATSKSTNP